MNASCSLLFIAYGAVVVVIVRKLDLQLPMQSLPINTRGVRANLAPGEIHSKQHYVMKFVSDFWQVGGFLLVLRFPPPIKVTVTIYLKYC